MMIERHPEIESLSVEISSSKSVFTVGSLDEGVETVFEDFPPELKYCTNFEVRVFAVNNKDETMAQTAFLSGTSMEAEAALMEVSSFLALCDMVSTDLYQMAVAITDDVGHVKKRICPPERNIMYIHNLYVEEAYRGAGIGKYLLDNINDLFSRSLNYSHHVCVLKPCPQEKLSDNSLRDKEGVSPEEVERLAAFYKKAGYQFIQGSDYMYRTQADTLLGWLDELCMENRGDGV